MRLPSNRLLALALVPLVCCGATGSCNNNNSFNVGPSTGQVVGAVVAVGAVITVTAVVLVEVHKQHHTLKGCVTSTPSGLELRTTENKTYALSGTTTDITPGSTVRLHGDREKHDKNAPGDQTFIVQKMQKNYGPCQALAQSANQPGNAPAPAKQP